MTNKTITGLESIIDNPPSYLNGKRLGLLANPASVDTRFNHALDLINERFNGQVTAIFSPQHGFYAEKQDNMIESDHFLEPVHKVPVYSLYSNTRVPEKEMFDQIDILIIDIQDVGTRVYTFIYTISYCLEVAAAMNKKIIILDRPNPIGGVQIEGNVLSTQYQSFVGRFPIPMRHGMTVGEISQFFNVEFKIGADLEIIPMQHWSRDMYWQDTGMPWIAPSPNLPTPQSAMVYPGQVIFEGTNVSEGRGTTLPFEQFGAPYINPEPILNDLSGKTDGAVLRIVNFEPTSGKWQKERCFGFQIHVTDPTRYRPYHLSLLLLQMILRHHGDAFQFKDPPYEYEYDRMPIDLILGSQTLRQDLVMQKSLVQLEKKWQPALDQFKRRAQGYYLYE